MSSYKDYNFLFEIIIKIIDSAPTNYNNLDCDDMSYRLWVNYSKDMLTLGAKNIDNNIVINYINFQTRLLTTNTSNVQKISYSIEYLKELLFLLQKNLR